ncbi:MAG TPA: Holliday junction resolvase RuvX [Pelomicrobium sp.]|nr:Holliday junction resolvase RuvX [Pelomicrobium sp.]
MRDERTPAGTALGFDFGERRIGIAVGTGALGVAHPLVTIEEPAAERRWQAIDAVIAEWRPELLVIGVPTRDDGEPHPVARQAERFARRLRERCRLPVRLVDERLSSWEAEQVLPRRRGGQRRGDLDRFAAKLILETYFSAPQLAREP